MINDDRGNGVRLALGRRPPDELGPTDQLAPGVDDALFREILKLPHLEGYAWLARLENLREVKIRCPLVDHDSTRKPRR